jgi:hypothetical protein
MAVPTDATKVFAPVQYTSAITPPTVTTGFPVDLIIDTIKGPANESRNVSDRLRGSGINFYELLFTNTSGATSSGIFTNAGYDLASNTSTRDGFFGTVYGAGYNCISWNFRRAPSFFDEVCYTGTGSNLTVSHNLGAVPEIIIIKKRVAIGSATNWYCGVNFTGSTYTEILLNADGGGAIYNYPNWFTSAPTTTTFSLAGGGNVNSSGATTVAYLFATCAGVSKVGSYTGTGAAQTINCGFTAGSRFVMIKRTDSTGDWYIWDSARGIIPSNDPYLLLNNTDAEVAGTDYVDTTNVGFDITSTAPAAINANGGTYIFLAIA